MPKNHPYLKRPSRAFFLLLAGLTLVAVAGVFYISRLNSQQKTAGPELFWGSLEKSLTTDGIACRIRDHQEDRQSDQKVHLDLSGSRSARTENIISHGSSSVSTEGIIDRDNEYVRYTAIQSGEQAANDKKLDFGKVLNLWGKRPVDPAKPTSLYGQTVLGGCVVPLANLPPQEARNIMDKLKQEKVFALHTDAGIWEDYKGERLRRYDVTVQPEPYISFMKQLAKQQGLKDLDSVTVESYLDKKPEKLEFLVSPETGQLAVIRYGDQKRAITFSEYGRKPDTSEPKRTIPLQELEKRLRDGQ